MITKISRIKDFGLFHDYSSEPSLIPFKKINLLYGCNGSGKSTLSRMFRCFELKHLHDDYPNASFEIVDESGKIYKSNFKEDPPNIKVFNIDFIEDNLKLSHSKTEPIIYISEEKIAEKESLEKLRVKEDELSDLI